MPRMDGTRIALGVIRGPRGIVWIERGTPPSLGRWALPGGRVEPGEEPLAAARREVQEETLLDVDDGRLLAVLEERFEEDRKSTRLNSSHSQQSRMPSSA